MRGRVFQLSVAGLAVVLATGLFMAARIDRVGQGFGPLDKEFYLTPEQLLFIRPGLVLKILEVRIPEDRRPVVRFAIQDPKGLPLDRDGIFTPGEVSTSFVLGYIPRGQNQYVSYGTRTQSSPITGESAIQATGDSGGTYTKIEDGVYEYRFGLALPADYDRDATHTLGIYARRDLSEFDLGRKAANAIHHFVPSGKTPPRPRDVVRTAACNQCHNPLAEHGEARLEVELCVLCHTPQSSDPDTGNTVDFKVMVHKIHRGAELPSVKAGEPYRIIGFRQSVHDYSTVEFPQDIRNCETCHVPGADQPAPSELFSASPNPIQVCDGSGLGQTTLHWDVPEVARVEVRVGTPDGPLLARGLSRGSKSTGKWVRDGTLFLLLNAVTGEVLATVTVRTTTLGCTSGALVLANGGGLVGGNQSAAWLLRPSRAACGSCHDDVDFATGVNHAGGPQVSDNLCSSCHLPEGELEFDASIRGAHTVPRKSKQLKGLQVTILDVTNTAPGESPTVYFKIEEKDGTPVAPADLPFFNLVMAGPTTDYGLFLSESARTEAVPFEEGYTYTFKGKIPEDAVGTFTMGAEAFRMVKLNAGTTKEMDFRETYQENRVFYFPVTDAAAIPRRMVVAEAKCNACHEKLELHGTIRHNPQEYCVTCHNANASDILRRPEAERPEESIHFKYLIHRIHRGEELNRPFTVFGFGGSRHDFHEVRFPGDLRDCESCHVNESYRLPLPGGLLPTVSPREFFNPLPPITAACVGCHDSEEAAAHAATMTAVFGEACAACHGTGKEFSVERVHAR